MEATAEHLKLAIRVAKRLWRDPEAESIAGEVVTVCVRNFDMSRNVPIEAWITHCVKQGIWGQWRKMRVRKCVSQEMPVTREDDTSPEPVAPEQEQHFNVPRDDWDLLCKYYLDEWCLDVIARRHKMSVAAMKQRLSDAREHFFAAYHVGQ